MQRETARVFCCACRSNAHGHDDVPIAAGLVRERAELAGGAPALFLKKLDSRLSEI